MRHPVLAFLLLAPGFVAAPTYAQAVPAAPMLDRWEVVVAPGKCTLSRRYSQPAATRLTIDTDVGTGDYSLSIAMPGLERQPVGLPGEAVLKADRKTAARGFVTVFREGEAGAPLLANMAGLSAGAMTALAAARELSISGEQLRVKPLALPAAAQAMAALRTCENEQMVEWGADPAQFAPGGSMPRVRDLHALLPQSALRKMPYPAGPANLMHVLVIDERGAVASCASSGALVGAPLEKTVCAQLVGKVVGTPAKDPGGKPVRGVVGYFPALIRSFIVQTPI
ncbi:hypothetical protein GCM10022280_25010 [Sphingomonas swuensis]|uniref:TonB C-terminal domain-containing protein n=1 Tax=Sphingomonas swuensis TaxID=977800 RepID=A0ABP7TAC5_9SPHN